MGRQPHAIHSVTEPAGLLRQVRVGVGVVAWASGEGSSWFRTVRRSSRQVVPNARAGMAAVLAIDSEPLDGPEHPSEASDEIPRAAVMAEILRPRIERPDCPVRMGMSIAGIRVWCDHPPVGRTPRRCGSFWASHHRAERPSRLPYAWNFIAGRSLSDLGATKFETPEVARASFGPTSFRLRSAPRRGPGPCRPCRTRSRSR